jgi:hypothetical protein
MLHSACVKSLLPEDVDRSHSCELPVITSYKVIQEIFGVGLRKLWSSGSESFWPSFKSQESKGAMIPFLALHIKKKSLLLEGTPQRITPLHILDFNNAIITPTRQTIPAAAPETPIGIAAPAEEIDPVTLLTMLLAPTGKACDPR